MPLRRRARARTLLRYGASSALQEPHTARPNQSSVGLASTNPRGGSMGLQGPPYAVLSPLVTDPLAPPGDPESSLCHFEIAEMGKTGHGSLIQDTRRVFELF